MDSIIEDNEIKKTITTVSENLTELFHTYVQKAATDLNNKLFTRYLKTRNENKSQSWYCFCEQAFLTKASLNRHIRHIHKENFEIFQCGICCRTFQKYAQLRLHVKYTHTKKDIYKCNNDNCNMTFLSLDLFEQHNIDVHQLHLCRICCQLFEQKLYLDVHNNFIHGNGGIPIYYKADKKQEE
jgi:hypothetical protein